MDNQLSPEQEHAKEEQMMRGNAFEELVRTEGWKLVMAYYENRVKALTTGILMADDRGLQDFEPERRELVGIRKLLALIESDMEALRRDRESRKPSSE